MYLNQAPAAGNALPQQYGGPTGSAFGIVGDAAPSLEPMRPQDYLSAEVGTLLSIIGDLELMADRIAGPTAKLVDMGKTASSSNQPAAVPSVVDNIRMSAGGVQTANERLRQLFARINSAL